MKNLLDPGSGHDLVVPVLGIAPLLAVAVSLETSAAIGVVNLLALVTTAMIISSIRHLLPLEIRLTAILLIAASVISLIDVFMQYRFYEISRQLGFYLPLLAMNALVLAWAEEHALRNGIISSLSSTLKAGTAILVVVTVIGATREYAGLSLLKQPAGAFLVLGLLLALYNLVTAGRPQSN